MRTRLRGRDPWPGDVAALAALANLERLFLNGSGCTFGACGAPRERPNATTALTLRRRRFFTYVAFASKVT